MARSSEKGFCWLNDAGILGATMRRSSILRVSYDLTYANEPIGLACRIPLGEAPRSALVGLEEHMSA